MNKGMSIYLEFVRVFATLLVLFSHAGHFAPSTLQNILANLQLGRDGVILFFVLSGYVITWCAIEKEKNWRTFAINRVSRIYSVAIPGLILGAAVSVFLTSQNAHSPDYYTTQKPWIYYPLFLTFYSQSWFGFIFPAGNFPYWSLSFEVWYYIFIGTFIFVNKLKVFLIAIVLLLMGPYIILFLPLWGLGALLFVNKDKFALSRISAVSLFIITIVTLICIKFYNVDTQIDSFNTNVLGSISRYLPAKQFLGDYLLAIIATVNFYAAYQLNLSIGELTKKAVKTFAGFSFSIYMFHTPIFLILEATFLKEKSSYSQYISAIVIALCISYFFSFWTEKKKEKISVCLKRLFL